MSTPFHAEITPITNEEALIQCEELIQVYEEACQFLNAKQLLHSLRANVSEKQVTNESVALSMLNLFEINDISVDLLPLFNTLAKTNPSAVWNTALELNLMLEHYLECGMD